MKIKDNKALREVLPDRDEYIRLDCSAGFAIDTTLDTTLPPAKECCEVDVEKLIYFLDKVNNWENKPANGYLHHSFRSELANAIANADVLKWRGI